MPDGSEIIKVENRFTAGQGDIKFGNLMRNTEAYTYSEDFTGPIFINLPGSMAPTMKRIGGTVTKYVPN